MAELFNACEYLLDRRLAAGDGGQLALTGPAGELSYAQLHDRVLRAAGGLRGLGLEPEQRVLMCMADSPEFVVVYLAAMRIGAIPVPVSTMIKAAELGELLRDSRARLLAVTGQFAGLAREAAPAAPELRGVLAPGGTAGTAGGLRWHALDELLASARPESAVYTTSADSPAFWLYTSGTTGTPKGAMHRHGSIRVVCETYGAQVLGIRPDDRCLSAAKAFFAYGLGNSVLFPLAAGAAAILEPAPAKPDVIAGRAGEYGATLFFAGPTFFANMLRADLPADALAGARLAASAGEALPASLYARWTSHFGVDILDGIGMTEMLHIFLSNRAGDVRPGTTGVAVPGYELKIVDEAGREVPPGTPGTLLVRGASAATGYWSRYDASRQVFQGEWLRTGDTYVQDADGYYACLGRTGDMLKASGIWVSPAEVEARLLTHPAVAQAVVVAAPDTDGLEKPVAYVILEPGGTATDSELIAYCRDGLPAFKRPRKIVFVGAYPTTATGKVRRVELRQMATTVLVGPQVPAAAAPGPAAAPAAPGPAAAPVTAAPVTAAPVTDPPATALHWVKEDAPRWDASKQRLFGPAELASVGLDPPAPGAPVADEWWRVTDDEGNVVGYGWLDSEWGDAQITFWVAPGSRGAGIGSFILDRLEAEAARRGLNYIYNVVPDTHPDRAWMRHWLILHGFSPGTGDLRRQVRSGAGGRRAGQRS